MPSDLEELFMAELERNGKDIPPFDGEPGKFRFHPKRKWQMDFAWFRYLVAVEIDGGQWKRNGGRHARDEHREKINAAMRLGWAVLHYSGEQLKNDPLQTIDDLRAVLKLRGWKPEATDVTQE